MMNPAPRQLPHPSDEELLSSVADGEGEALGELMLRHQSALYGFVLRSTGDTTLSADIVQDTFVRVWQRAESFRPDRGAAAKTWLCAVAVNLVRDEIRRRARRTWWTSWFPGEDRKEAIDKAEIPDPTGDLAHRAERDEHLERLSRAVATLPEKLRLPLVLCVLEGMPQEEAAEILKTTRKAVELRIRRAKASLRGLLEANEARDKPV